MSAYFNLINTEVLDQRIKSEVFPFSKYIFWDSPIENIDLIKHRRYIVERVLNRGFLEDVYVLTKLYSKEEIKDALRKSKELDPKTINFCSQYFNLPKSEMDVSSFYS